VTAVRAIALVLGLLLAARAAAAETVERTIDVDGVRRAYLVHVPPGLDRSKPAPLVLVFHGAGSDAESMVRATGFDAMADRERFVVAYLRARRPALRYDADMGSASNDVRFVRALLERLRGRLAVDPRRVFATGFSNGAAFCYRLAAEMPEEVAAIAPVAGYLPASLRAGQSAPVSLLATHGTRDARVEADPAEVARWASWCGCAGTPVPAPAPDLAPLRARRLVHPCPEGVGVAFLTIEGAGHEWPGGAGGPLSRAVWDFFRSHPRPAAAPR
jgi:polyhydroxybutyrate depolymerase